MAKGRKASRRTSRRDRRRAIAFAALTLSMLAMGVWAAHPHVPASLEAHPGVQAAVLIDQLGFNAPNATFVSEATALLEAAGYVVDYVPWEEATLRYYRTLPAKGYELVLLRTHATAVARGGQAMDTVAVFTGEQATHDGLRQTFGWPGTALVRYNDAEPGEQEPLYLSFTDRFVRRGMQGNFGGATVLMMGCQGMANPFLADAVLARGAGAYVGWNATITAQETDGAFLRLLKDHLAGKSLGEATAKVNAWLERGSIPHRLQWVAQENRLDAIGVNQVNR